MAASRWPARAGAGPVMSQEAEQHRERFRDALAGALRAVSQRSDVDLRLAAPGYRPAAARAAAAAETGPIEAELASRPSPRDVAVLRGRLDHLACRLRFHDEKAFRRFTPKEPLAARIFAALEDGRVGALGARRFAGLARNLVAAEAARRKRLGLEGARSREEIPIEEALRARLLQQLGGIADPGLEALYRPWARLIADKAADLMDELCRTGEDPAAFARLSRRLLARLELLSEEEQIPEEEPETGEDGQPPETGEDAAAEMTGSGEDAPESEETAAAESAEEGEAAEEDDEGMAVRLADSPLLDADPDAESAPDVQPPGHNRPADDGPQTGDYRVFTTAFDRVERAEDLASGEELARLRALLDQQAAPLARIVGRLANRLQRRLMAQQNRAWEFDLEEGVLDTARLARVVASPSHPLSYKQEKESAFRDTVVGLLIDNSGSMRGRPISIAAVSADIMARTLERCGVAVEVLGFTTRAWKGGESREAWLKAGKPLHPGRLNDLLHIIYKPAEVPYRRARRNLGLMLKEGLLKENIDGEALLWAHQRLIARPEERRILMVIS
ncbi:MAG: cobaltochelatase subunit CobT, partial [Alphaproteobacteria bacterium]